MKKTEWNNYWDKKINEHFNVKPAERIILREFVEEVFNEKYGIKEAELSVDDLFKQETRYNNFFNKINTGTFFKLSKKTLAAEKIGIGKSKIPFDVKSIPADEVGYVKVEKGPETTKSMERLEVWKAFTSSDSQGKQKIVQNFIKKNKLKDLGTEEAMKKYKKSVLGGLKFETDYYETNDEGQLTGESVPVLITMSTLEKTSDFGGPGEKKGPTGAQWEDIISDAINKSGPNPEFDFDKTFFDMGEKIATNARAKIPKNLMKSKWITTGTKNGTFDKVWLKAFEDVGASLVKKDGTQKDGPTSTYKTDVMTQDGKLHMSFKKSGGSQLMSAAQGETLATIRVVSEKYGITKGPFKKQLLALENAVKTKFQRLKVDGLPIEQVTQVQKRLDAKLKEMTPEQVEAWKESVKDPENIKTIEDKLLSSNEIHDQLTCMFEEILNQELTLIAENKDNVISKAINASDSVRFAIVEEAMTGRVKFVDGDDAIAEHMFVFDTSSGEVEFNVIDDAFINSKASKTKFYFSFKTGGGGSASGTVLRGGTSKTADPSTCKASKKVVSESHIMEFISKRTKTLLEENRKDLRNRISKDEKFMNECAWFFSQDEETRLAILQENKLGDFLNTIGSKIGDGIDSLSDTSAAALEKLAQGSEWVKDKAISSAEIVAEFVKDAIAWVTRIFNEAKQRILQAWNEGIKELSNIGEESGAIAGMEYLGLTGDVQIGPIKI